MATRGAQATIGGVRPRADARRGRGWYAALARAGLVTKGVSFGIVGVLAIELATGRGGKATSREGALHDLARDGFGQVLLSALALGFAAYAVWRFVEAYAEPQDGASAWAKRAGYVARGAIYGTLAYSAAKLVLGAGGGESQNGKAHHAAAEMLSWPAGTWLVGTVGAIVVGTGLWNVYRGITRSFEDRWETGRMSSDARKWGSRAGLVGHLARGVVFTLIGIFGIRAAVQYDPHEAIGMDGALQKLAHEPYGPYLLGLAATGLVCYGLYCLVDARYRDVSPG
jgi:uncharacterized protein DUF1206